MHQHIGHLKLFPSDCQYKLFQVCLIDVPLQILREKPNTIKIIWKVIFHVEPSYISIIAHKIWKVKFKIFMSRGDHPFCFSKCNGLNMIPTWLQYCVPKWLPLPFCDLYLNKNMRDFCSTKVMLKFSKSVGSPSGMIWSEICLKFRGPKHIISNVLHEILYALTCLVATKSHFLQRLLGYMSYKVLSFDKIMELYLFLKINMYEMYEHWVSARLN